MSELAPILKFHRATLETGRNYDSGISSADLALGPGELGVILLEREHPRLPLADLACGLADPSSGEVLFQGLPWNSYPPARAAKLRGLIGRVFDDGGWVNSLKVDQNVTLVQRHHTSRPVQEIEDEAAGLARAMGLPGLPRGQPWQGRRHDLRRAACVRALLGQPILLLLERPTSGGLTDLFSALVNQLRAARARGAAVLWMTDDPREWADVGLRPTFRGRMVGPQIMIDATSPTMRANPAAPRSGG